MFTLNLNDIKAVTSDELKSLASKIPEDETSIEVIGDNESSELNNLISFLTYAFQRKDTKLTTIKLYQMKLVNMGVATTKRVEKILSFFTVAYLNEYLIEKIQSLHSGAIRQGIENNLKALKKLIIIDANGNEAVFESPEAIADRLEKILAEKKPFRPNVQDFVWSLELFQLKKIIASIPENQTELDLSGNDFDKIQFSRFMELMIELPSSLNILRLQNIKLHTLNYFDFHALLSSCTGKFQTVYFTREEIEQIPINEPYWQVLKKSTKLVSFLETVPHVYLVDASGKQTTHTGKMIIDFITAKQPALTADQRELQQTFNEVEHRTSSFTPVSKQSSTNQTAAHAVQEHHAPQTMETIAKKTYSAQPTSLQATDGHNDSLVTVVMPKKATPHNQSALQPASARVESHPVKTVKAGEDISAISQTIQEQITKLKLGSQSFFAFNKMKKATLIETALKDAQSYGPLLGKDFLNYKKDAQSLSIRDALNYNRLFIHKEKTTTLLEVENKHPTLK